MTDKEIESAIVNGIANGIKPVLDRVAALELKPANQTATAAATAAAADPAVVIANAVNAAMKPFSDKLDKMEKTTVQSQAHAAVVPHITRGAIAPQDTDTITFWENAWVADAKSAEKQMAKLPAAKTSRVIPAQARAAGEVALPSDPDEQIIIAANEVVKASGGKITLADAIIASARTPAFTEHYKEFRNAWSGVQN